MFSKAITPFGICLLATAGFAWLANTFIQPADATGSASVAQASLLPSLATKSDKLKTPSDAPKAVVKVVDAYPKLKFDAPVEYTYAQDGTNRLFVVEQAGRIRSFDNSASATAAPVYLDIRNKVGYGGEMGLLGLAFHPKFRENGYFYVNYTKNNPRETIISRFKAASPSATTVDPATEVVLIRFSQPYANHNGGKVLFGPDGYLYISTGDGGSGGDPHNNAQNRQSWLGKVLRIDVNSTEKGHYGIPTDNPFANEANARPEIYAYGLRNPWRISFDQQNRLWAGDVGQNELEEVDILTKGGNYGWRIEEGRQSYKEPDGKKPANLIEPIWQYKHDDGNVSITGGNVYRGSAIPSLRGKYIYADFASGRVWALTTTDGRKATNQEIIARAGSISAFGEDQKKELYLCDLASGKILKLAD